VLPSGSKIHGAASGLDGSSQQPRLAVISCSHRSAAAAGEEGGRCCAGMRAQSQGTCLIQIAAALVQGDLGHGLEFGRSWCARASYPVQEPD
jgi:hypothetical protein